MNDYEHDDQTKKLMDLGFFILSNADNTYSLYNSYNELLLTSSYVDDIALKVQALCQSLNLDTSD